MIHGTFSLSVVQPETVALRLSGLGAQDTAQFTDWFREQVLKVIRDNLAELCVTKSWPLLHLTSGAYTEEIERTVLGRLRAHCDAYGVRIQRLGNLHVAINDEDEQTLNTFYEKSSYIRMMGGLEGYSQYADAEVKLGAAKGLAQAGAGGSTGGGASSGLLEGAGLGLGMAMANQFATQNPSGASVNLPGQQPSAPSPVQGAKAQTCGECGAAARGKFCAECGHKLAPVPRFCSECGTRCGEGKFCHECGTTL